MGADLAELGLGPRQNRQAELEQACQLGGDGELDATRGAFTGPVLHRG